MAARSPPGRWRRDEAVNVQDLGADLPRTARWLLRFGYDGTGYFGWARQPGLRTVEGEIRRGIQRQRIATAAASTRVEVASRTDRGVSAVGNALTLASPLAPNALLRALNGIAPDIVFTAASEVPDGFRVRKAVRRVYRYFEPAHGHDFEVWQSTARRFSGSVDVRSLGRGLPAGVPIWRTVESVTVTRRTGGATVEVRAPSFVWGMVRKIISALREVEAGRVSLDELEAALRGRTRLTLPMAEPERLVLWDVEFPIPWQHFWAGPNRHQVGWARSAQDSLWVRQALLEGFSSVQPTSPEGETAFPESMRDER
ncbi:MAG TPA: hypothetical protein VEG66_07855 [Thermoplasmata archaeon]|jgi:tRNA pseudouridine38-40 synthase|nr:hypothetical protein [Thermoplasmata archaeon]